MDRLISMLLRQVLRHVSRKMATQRDGPGGTSAPEVRGATRKQMQMARRLGRMVGRF